MDKKQQAGALRALAQNLDFEAAGQAAGGLTDRDWRALLNQAADLMTPPDKPKPKPPSKAPDKPKQTKSNSRAVLFTDGASRGNPGPAAAGASLVLGVDEVGLVSQNLGRLTNNQAEYRALILGLEMALNLGFKELSLRLDSELIVRQIQGRYKVKNPAIKPLFDEAQALLKQLKAYDILHIERALNARADALANLALDNR